MLSFRQANLLQPPPLPAGSADIVFCRNILMYLDASSRVRVLQGLHGVMHAGSVLFLGAGETAGGLGEIFRPVAGMAGLYVRGDTILDLPLSPS